MLIETVIIAIVIRGEIIFMMILFRLIGLNGFHKQDRLLCLEAGEANVATYMYAYLMNM